jgi:hypothetical protein
MRNCLSLLSGKKNCGKWKTKKAGVRSQGSEFRIKGTAETQRAQSKIKCLKLKT